MSILEMLGLVAIGGFAGLVVGFAIGCLLCKDGRHFVNIYNDLSDDGDDDFDDDEECCGGGPGFGRRFTVPDDYAMRN